MPVFYLCQIKASPTFILILTLKSQLFQFFDYNFVTNILPQYFLYLKSLPELSFIFLLVEIHSKLFNTTNNVFLFT